MEICKDITLDNNLTMFPFIEVDKEYYQSLVIDIKSIPEDIHSVDDLIKTIDNPHKRLVFALAFLNNIYLQHHIRGFDFSPYEA